MLPLQPRLYGFAAFLFALSALFLLIGRHPSGVVFFGLLAVSYGLRATGVFARARWGRPLEYSVLAALVAVASFEIFM